MRKAKQRYGPARDGFSQEQSPFDHAPSAELRDLALGQSVPVSHLVARQAAAVGLLGGEKTARVGGRVTQELLDAARSASGLQSDTELLEYALSKVALEDDFGVKLLGRKGSIPKGVEL
jgi:hypothetical protein